MMLEMKSVSFQYADSTEGVYDVNLHVKKGECVVLTGPSGGGKSTLTRLINGLAPAHFSGSMAGSIRINGVNAANLTQWKRGRIVGSVFQNPRSQFFSSELAGEIAFAAENYGLHHDEIVSKTDSAIQAFGLDELRERPIDLLSSGEKQRTAIASVYALSPEIYVCDEPTANLDDESALELAKTFSKLKNEGHTLIIAEHRLAWLAGIVDRVVYVREGRILWQRTANEMQALSENERQKNGLRSTVSISAPNLLPPSGEGVPIVAADTVSVRMSGEAILENLKFKAWTGQIVAITGRNGVGKTTFARVLSGLQKENGGRVLLDGKQTPPRKRGTHIWFGSNDTSTQFFTNSVSEELLLQTKRSEETLEQARDILKQLGLYAYRDAHPATLSGGQKQRLSIACGILSDRDVLLLDEPTSGLDGENMLVIASALKKFATRGKTVLIITHDYELISECCRWRYHLSNSH